MNESNGVKNGGWSRQGKERFILLLKRVKRDRKSENGIKVETDLLRKYRNIVNRRTDDMREKRQAMKKKLDVHIDYDEDVNDDDDLASIDNDDVVAKNVDDSNDCNDDSNSIQSLSTHDKSQNLLSEASIFTGNAVPV